MAKRTYAAIGLMSGTSMDGIDLAFLETDGEAQVVRHHAGFVAYDAGFRRELNDALVEAASLTDRRQRPGSLESLERRITARHAEAVRDFVSEYGIRHVDIVGFHGQTVLHRPQAGMTVQLGAGQQLADYTGMKVAWDLRANDMTNGGQGAPLVPAYHAALARTLREPRKKAEPVAFANIGGIANITYVSGDDAPVAFDTGPGNALIDQVMLAKAGTAFDEGGAVGAQGKVHHDIVAAYMADPFIAKPAPKSLDRNDFTVERAARLPLADAARTLAAVTAETIHAACRHLPAAPKRWVLCGGGRRNINIHNDLARLAAADAAVVQTADELGFNGDSMEAEAWAYLAVRAMKGLPLSFPGTTGVSEPVTGGIISKPHFD